MTLDLVLAILHHLLMLAVAGMLLAELFILRLPASAATVRRLAGIDGVFGGAAGLLLVVGFLRVFLGARPESYYLENPFFWAKIAAFLVVGVISIRPTIRFIAWRKAVGGDAGFVPLAADVAGIRRLVHVEAAVFVLVPAFAAVMARYAGF